MALKDIFTMVKADRYTADGREEVIKAQEVDVEDKTYEIGEISQKTGLQKTANGWVKPKSGKQPGAKKANPTRTFESKSGPDGMPVAGSGKEVKTYRTKKEAVAALKKQNAAAGMQKVPGAQRGTKEFDKNEYIDSMKNSKNAPVSRMAREIQRETFDDEIKNTNGDKVKIESLTEKLLSPATENGIKISAESHENARNLVESRYRQLKKTAEEQSKPEGRNFRSELEANPKGAYDFEKTVEKSIPLSAGDKEVLGNVKSFMREEGTDYKDALKSVATGLVNGNKLHGDWYPEKEKSLLKIAKAVGMDEEVKSYVKTMAKGYDFGYSEDAAPRVLTGDCKIRVRK